MPSGCARVACRCGEGIIHQRGGHFWRECETTVTDVSNGIDYPFSMYFGKYINIICNLPEVMHRGTDQ